jgi:hypothetical protein
MFFILFFNYLRHFCFKNMTTLSINSIELFILKYAWCISNTLVNDAFKNNFLLENILK